MPSAEVIINEIIAEIGKDNPEIRARIGTAIGDITIDLLSQNNGEYSCLEKYQDITLAVGESSKMLNSDFKRAKKKSIILDSDGNFSDELAIVTNVEFFNRQADSSQYPGNEYARIETLRDGTDGPGTYIIFGTTMDATAYYKIFYYRWPLADDIISIGNPSLVKIGVRMHLADMKPEWQNSGAIYYGLRNNFHEDIEDRARELVIRPSRQKAAFNTMMHNIGRGQ